MNLVFEVVQGKQGQFEIIRNGKIVRSAVPDRWLEEELARYGFCGKEYKEIRDQLAESGTAKVNLGSVEW